MQQSEVARYLVRAVLDEDFRELARTDPERSFEGFTLSDDERDTLRRQNGDMLRLISAALPVVTDEQRRVNEEHPTLPVALPVSGRPLPPVDLLLQVVPLPGLDEQGALRVGHAVTLHVPSETGELPARPEGLPESAAPSVFLRVSAVPHAAVLPDGRFALTYAASTRIEQGDALGAAPVPPAAPRSPWGHRVDAPETLQAAAAVKAASPAERYGRLLELVAALTGAGGQP